MGRSIFSGLKGAKVRVDANYMRAGHYYMVIDKCKTGRNWKNIDFAAVEMTVVHVLDDNNGEGHKLGESPSWLAMSDSMYFASDILTFICNVMGLDPNELSDDERVNAAEMVFASEDDHEHDQPLAGTVVEVKARDVKIKDSDKMFTKVTFCREVPASELLERLSEEEINRFFPNDALKNLAAQEE
jgi:hypothetical protein